MKTRLLYLTFIPLLLIFSLPLANAEGEGFEVLSLEEISALVSGNNISALLQLDFNSFTGSCLSHWRNLNQSVESEEHSDKLFRERLYTLTHQEMISKKLDVDVESEIRELFNFFLFPEHRDQGSSFFGEGAYQPSPCGLRDLGREYPLALRALFPFSPVLAKEGGKPMLLDPETAFYKSVASLYKASPHLRPLLVKIISQYLNGEALKKFSETLEGDLEYYAKPGKSIEKEIKKFTDLLESNDPSSDIKRIKGKAEYWAEWADAYLGFEKILKSLRVWQLTPWWEEIKPRVSEVLKFTGNEVEAGYVTNVKGFLLFPERDEAFEQQKPAGLQSLKGITEHLQSNPSLALLFNKAFLEALRELALQIKYSVNNEADFRAQLPALKERVGKLVSGVSAWSENPKTQMTQRYSTELVRLMEKEFPTLTFDPIFGKVELMVTQEMFEVKGQPMTFAPIKAGTFMMGSPPNGAGRFDNELQHQVTLTKDFEMQTTEITQWQWAMIMGSNPSHFIGADLPVETVSWNDVQGFIAKLNDLSQRNDPLIYQIISDHQQGDTYRLPTEAEWEFAARGGETTAYSFGNDVNQLSEYAWFVGNSNSQTHPVATSPKGPNVVAYKNKFGLYDMHGNVWEWVQDWYGDYPSSSVTDPAGPQSGSGRVIRGGSWGNGARYLRSAYRYDNHPGHRYLALGFRLVRTKN